MFLKEASVQVMNLWPDENPLWQCPGYFVESGETHMVGRFGAKSLSLLDQECNHWDAPPEESRQMWQDSANAQAVASLFTTLLCPGSHSRFYSIYRCDATFHFSTDALKRYRLCLCRWTTQYSRPSTLNAMIGFTCDWLPSRDNSEQLRVFFIADTHILGVRNGHWFDKLRREWQMYRSYHTAVHLLSPDAVFFLGDLMDEGQWGNRGIFTRYADRFDSLFGSTSSKPEVHVLAGNHDLGFHYALSPSRVEWFEERFQP
ncbi:hypothetical protein KIN20_030291 [Parelaphostrongylus tenuis]|uniref:Calcineurin-like phosphoesterase domain-containing protein n=1 Tax=Parelaphostrongylus tenuis TaxID=148309 RepID=A0AAD5WGC8_PARTN|nr:hypothetical protein KIN20_030291 [Parelaphostrongylus tenuis]